MTWTVSRGITSAASVLVAALALTACSQASTPPAPEPSRSAAAPTAEPAAEQPSSPPTAPTNPDLTCETIISAGTVKALTDSGWTAEQGDFTIGTTTLANGIRCAWADWGHPSDHGQLFAWAPLPAGQGEELQAQLLSEGWLRETGDAGVYITEDPAVAFQTDEDGYGMTYLFGDESVKLADTKQSLILIEVP